MATRKHSRSWKLLRIYFRRFRLGLWLVSLALLGALLYVNQIGLPDFVKNPLLEKLRARGLDLQFTRLRLRFPHGLVADNVRFGGTNNSANPALTLQEIQVRLDYAALAHGRLQVNSLLLRQGRLVWPVNESNQPPRALTVENIQTQLRLLPGDLWELDQFTAQFAGANIELAGTVTNASAIQDWKLFQPGPAAAPGPSLPQNLRRLADALDRIRFPRAPELHVEIFGDARDLPGFGARLTLRAPGAETPWGTFAGGVLSARLTPPEKQQPSHAEILLRTARAQTPWATADNLDLTLHVLSDAGTNFNADLYLTAARVETAWGRGRDAHFSAQWRHAATNAIPLSGHGELELAAAETPWGNGRGLHLVATLTAPTNPITSPDPGWGWWTNLAPFGLEVRGGLNELAAPELSASNLLWTAQWQAPRLQVTRLAADLYQGSLTAQAKLDVATREFHVTGAADFDVQKISALLPPASRPILAEFSWARPPRLQAAASFILPAWTNQSPDWLAEIKPTLNLDGQVAVAHGAFRDVTFDSADFHFARSNRTWRIPDLLVTRPEGRLELACESSDITADYFFKIHSSLDVDALKLLLPPEARRGFDLAGFTEPPVVDAELRGRWETMEGFDAKGRVALTNFTFRGETASGFQSAVEFTNQILTLTEPRVQRGEEHVSAEWVRVDLAAEKVFLTNVFGFANPLVFARAIGPVAGAWFEPYHFFGTPTARVNGSIDFDIHKGVDLHFDFEGGPFAWWKFNVRRIAGQVNWVNDSLTLNNIHAEFYQGTAEGGAEFYFPPGADNRLRFEVAVTNADLHLLLGDLNTPTNKLKGRLTGRWAVTQGIPETGATWAGHGHASLRDGLLMEVPIFGILTPALEGISPGLGSTRLSEGTATFVLTNGLIHSDDMDIRASGMRLQYRGNVNLDGQVDAVAEAELFRDTWMVGRVLSLVLWPVSKVFEYKITGPLGDPKMEPLYFVPRMILLPLHPFDTMKDLLPKAPEVPGTNAPPEVK